MKTSLRRIVFLVIFPVLGILFTAGCGTVRGFGGDVESVGENIEDSAR